MATLLKRSLNPAKKFRETKGSPHARAHRRTFKQKCRDTFSFFNGNFFTEIPQGGSKKNAHFGLLDYVFFPLSLLCYICLDKAERLSRLRRRGDISLFLIGIIFGLPKYLTSCVLTFLSLPFIGIAHGISLIKGRKLKNTFINSPTHIPVMQDEDRGDGETTTLTVLRYLQLQQQNGHTYQPITPTSITSKQNFVELVKDEKGKVTGFSLYIGSPVRGGTYPNDVTDEQGNIIHHAGDTYYRNPSVRFDATNHHGDQTPGMWAALKLNLGGVQTLVEKERAAGTEISKLFKY